MAEQNQTVQEENLLDIRVADASKLYKFYLNYEKPILGLTSVAIFLIAWELVGGTFQLINPLFMSAPSLIWKAGKELAFSAEFWNDVMNFEALARYGTISPEDLDLFFQTDSVDEAFDHLTRELTEYALEKPGPGL